MASCLLEGVTFFKMTSRFLRAALVKQHSCISVVISTDASGKGFKNIEMAEPTSSANCAISTSVLPL